METKHKLAVVVIVLALAAGVVALILIKIGYKSDPASEATATPAGDQAKSGKETSGVSVTATKGAGSQADWRVYTNDEYKFQLTLTDIWKGYEVKKGAAQDTKAVAVYQFLLATTDKNYRDLTSGKAVPLTIYVYKTSDWEGIDKNTIRQSELGKSGSYTLAYSTWEESPTDLAGITEKDLADIIKTFKAN